MKAVYILSTITLGLAVTLAGCAESQTLMKDVAKSVTTATSTPTTKVSQFNKAKDMVYYFGWMEDACTGSQPSYSEVRQRYEALKDSIQLEKPYTPDMSSNPALMYDVKSRSQWLSDVQPYINDVNRSMTDNGMLYRVVFKDNVVYRGQPLKEFRYSFMPDTEGASEQLVFTSNANVPAIWSNFKTREVEMPWAMVDMGAKYNSASNIISCNR